MRAIPALLAMPSAGAAPLPAVQVFDLGRYMGRWYVIADVPSRFARGRIARSDDYQLQADGRIRVSRWYRHDFDHPPRCWHGRAWLPEPTKPSRWRLQWLWPWQQDRIIIALSEDRQVSLVGGLSRRQLWIMARSPSVDEAVYQELLQVAAGQGFATDRVRRLVQLPEQRGLPGFA